MNQASAHEPFVLIRVIWRLAWSFVETRLIASSKHKFTIQSCDSRSAITNSAFVAPRHRVDWPEVVHQKYFPSKTLPLICPDRGGLCNDCAASSVCTAIPVSRPLFVPRRIHAYLYGRSVARSVSRTMESNPRRTRIVATLGPASRLRDAGPSRRRHTRLDGVKIGRASCRERVYHPV